MDKEAGRGEGRAEGAKCEHGYQISEVSEVEPFGVLEMIHDTTRGAHYDVRLLGQRDGLIHHI